jgi:hypothetical protein
MIRIMEICRRNRVPFPKTIPETEIFSNIEKLDFFQMSHYLKLTYLHNSWELIIVTKKRK